MAWPMCTWAMVGGRLVHPVMPSTHSRATEVGRCLILTARGLFLFQLTHQSEPDAVAVVNRREMIAGRHARIGWRGEPGAATQVPLRAISALPGGSVAGGAAIVGVPTILDPFKNVSQHVVQAEGIRGERAHGR